MVYAAILTAVCMVALTLGAGSEHPLPWEVWPAVLISATLLCAPVASWLSGKRATFDPIAIFSVFGLHFFIFAPIYQYTQQYYPYVRWNASFEAWVAPWFWLQAGILLLVALSLGRTQRHNSASTPSTIDLPPGLQRFLLLICAGTLATKMATIAIFGGLGGLASAYEARLQVGVLEFNPMAGFGPLVLIGDMFPLALGVLLIVAGRRKRILQSNVGFFALMLLIVAIAIPLVGLQGSRSSVAFVAALTALYYHFLVRRLRMRHLLIGTAALIVFMQAYLAYKFGGWDAIFSEQARQTAFLGRQLDDQMSFVLIRDLSRMDMQVIAMHGVFEGGYPLSWGRSIVSGMLSVLPGSLFPWRGTTFVMEKSEIVFAGRSFTQAGGTTFLFGLVGEFIVNFGWGALLFGVFLGRILRRLHKVIARAGDDPVAALIAPPLVIIPIALLLYDSNALVLSLIQLAALPLVVSWWVRRRMQQRARKNSAASVPQAVSYS